MDSTTGGNWITGFGSTAYVIAGASSSISSGISFQVLRGTTHVWQGITGDTRALRASPSDPSRIASAWYDDSSVQIELSSTQPNEFALYFLDWDRQSRVQDLAIIDKQSGVSLLQKRVDNFGNGVYVRFRLEGTITVRSTRVSGPNAVLAGIFAGGAIQAPSGAPLLSVVPVPSALIIRVPSQAGTTIEIQSSSDLQSWNKVSEHPATLPITEVQIPTRFQNQYFRAVVLN